MVKIVLLATAMMMLLSPAYGGWLDEAVQGAAENLGRRAVDEAADSAYDATRETARDSVKKGAHSEDSDRARPRSSGQSQRNGSGSSPESSRDHSTSDAIYSKYDFVPGDKVIFFDDFSDTDVGEFPRKWTLDGPKGDWNNAVEVVEYKGKKFLRTVPAKEEGNQGGSTQYVRLNKKGDLPQKFTVEFDAYLGSGEDDDSNLQYFLLMTSEDDYWPVSAIADLGSVMFTGVKGQSKNTETSVQMNDNRLHHIAVSVNGTFVKAYMDNERVVNDPDGVRRPIKRIGLYMGPYSGVRSDKIMFGNFRLAEGGKDIKAALDTDGKIVTHGILFDTGSDRLKPESLPTLKKILAILQEDRGLKFSIEGHTDSQGSKSSNNSLSENRARSVKSWLTEEGIAAGRLKAKGWGDSKPLDSNATPEGRANNRRVEFIRF